MRAHHISRDSLRKSALLTALALLPISLLTNCSGDDGSTGPPGPPGPAGGGGPTNTELEQGDDVPGIHVTIVSLGGASAANGAFQAGEHISVTYSVKKTDGTDWDLAELNDGRVLASGPSFNYQIVLPEESDVVTASVDNGDGTFTYTFASAIPATYPPPLNDSPAFDAADGELKDQPLLSGTYTLGLYFGWNYTMDDESFRDAGNVTQDFLFGSATQIDERQVVKQDNCNACHTSLRAHGDLRRDVKLCVLCHTAGSEDRISAAAGGTPGVSIDFRVMIHRIHNGSHLPSVLGVATADDGTVEYDADPAPYQIVGFGDSINDFSDVNFPVWPNLNVAMPKDAGYSLLSSTDPDGTGPLLSPRARSDAIRTGVTACAKCHGDPDASGPLTAPAQGDLYKAQPSEKACYSCHDDVRAGIKYTQNQQTMPDTVNNAICVQCHPQSGGSLAIENAHKHPLENSQIDTGVNLVITDVTGGSGPGNNFQVGDTPTIEFTLKNDAGADIGLASMDSGSAFFFGPNNNRQLVMPLPSTNGLTVSPFDFTGRLQASSGSGKGSMSKVFLGATQVTPSEILTVEFTSSTAFSVTGSVSGALGSGALPAATSVFPSGASISGFELGAGLAVNETVVVAFTSNTHFTVTGSVSGAIGSGDLPGPTSASTRFTSPDFSFNISVGSTALTGGSSVWNIGIFRGSAANPVAFAIVAGTTAFASAAPRPDRFYYEVWADDSSYAVNMPMDLVYEFLGDSTNAIGQTLTAGNVPVYYGRQQLWQATAGATTTTTTADVAAFGRQVSISATAGFLNGDVVVIEPAAGIGQREYVQIAPQRADGVVQASAPSGDPSGSAVKLNFKTPLRYAHASGATITKVTLALRQEGGVANDYGLTPATGTITANVAFSAGVGMVMSYRTDARFGYWLDNTGLPAAHVTTYVPPANDSADIGQEQGDWQGLPYLDGTYTADLWLYKNIDLGLQNELQTYRSTSNAGTFDFLYGTATEIVPHAIISSSANCYTCHNDVIFHGGGRRGLDACLTCHSISGNEDKPRWDTPNQSSAAPTVVPTELTTGVAIEFRQMLHKIHKGAELTHFDTYAVVGNGGNSTTFGEVEFPAMPGGVRQCIRCHGNDAWKAPSDREHDLASVPVRTWGVVCGACHDSDAAHAHIDVQTSTSGAESCSVCHGVGKEWAVQRMHKTQ